MFTLSNCVKYKYEVTGGIWQRQYSLSGVVPFGMVQVSSRLYTRSSVAIVGKLAVDGSVDNDRGLMK